MPLPKDTLVLHGRYRIDDLLGEGASAEVYLATQLRLRAPRALKILRRAAAGGDTDRIDEYRARFELEGELQEKLGDNPNIVRVFDTDEHDGAPVLVMEYLPGKTLKTVLRALGGRGMPWRRCAEVLRDVAYGLQALHEKQFVHRDVKPSNVLFAANGRAKLGDLGVAQTDVTRTRTEEQARDHPGTPGYASPEHAAGRVYLTPAADVYALGVMGFEMLSGRLPQPAAAENAAPEIGGDAPEWLKRLIQRMLAFDYCERLQDGGAVAEEISRGLLAEAERQAQRATRAAQLKEFIQSVLKKQPPEYAELTQADAWVEELLQLVPDDAAAMALDRKVARALHDSARHNQPAPSVTPPQAGDAREAQVDAAQRLRQSGSDRVGLLVAPGVEMVFVRVPAGDALLGCDRAGDPLATDDEAPLRLVSVPEFWMGIAPVTNALWTVFAGATNYASMAETEGASFARSGCEGRLVSGAYWAHPRGSAIDIAERADHPVVHVNCNDVEAFCQWASESERWRLQLPSEAEWEKAARGVDGRRYPWGNQLPDSSNANFNMRVGDTTAVGMFGSIGQSPYGCDDMAGNVWEWTRNAWEWPPYGGLGIVDATPQSGLRALRGGSFEDGHQFLRCACRDCSDSRLHYGNVGFRLVIRLLNDRRPSLGLSASDRTAPVMAKA